MRISGLTITSPRIDFDIAKKANETPADGHVYIFNLSKQIENQIYSRNDTLVLDAGYEGNVGTLFDGSVQRVERDRERLARITRIYVGDATVEQERLGGVSLRSYSGEESIRTIATDIVSDLGLELGPLDAIPEEVVEDWEWVGGSTKGLSDLLDGYGIQWYHEDGTIHFASTTDDPSQPGAETVDINIETGMIGSPSLTTEGARVRSLLNPRMRIGGRINLSSDVLNGTFAIVAVRHHGSNWKGSTFYSEVDMREI